jgi:hypothetical protein
MKRNFACTKILLDSVRSAAKALVLNTTGIDNTATGLDALQDETEQQLSASGAFR